MAFSVTTFFDLLGEDGFETLLETFFIFDFTADFFDFTFGFFFVLFFVTFRFGHYDVGLSFKIR
jgi:hypothetical protein